MRFSSAEQAKGDSLARQRSLAAEYIARHHEKNLELASDLEFVDEGVSSFAGQNLQPGRALHRFLEAVKLGVVEAGSVLMVESLDRLSRQQVIESQRLLLDILLQGVSVITTSPTEAREYDNRSGLHDLIISLAGMERANQESAIKSDRVRRAWKRKKSAAGETKVTSRAPAWLRLSQDRSKFELIDEKVVAVRRVFELAETMGQHAIARVLNSEGVPPLMGRLSGWHSSSVVKLLSSTAVIGTYQPHERHRESGRRVPDGPPVEGYYPGIIDPATFYRVQALRAGRKGKGAGRKGTTFTNLFTGIAKCALCGSSMVMVNKGKPPKGTNYLVCSAARRGLGCVYHAVQYRHCELGFITDCQRVDVSMLLPGQRSDSESSKLRKQRATAAGELAQKRAVVERMVESVIENGGELPRAIGDQIKLFEARITALEQEMRELTVAIDRVAAEGERIAGLSTKFSELLRLMGTAEPTERYTLRARFNDLLQVALAGVEIGPADPGLKGKIDQMLIDHRRRMYANHPEFFDRAEALGLTWKTATRGALTSFKVVYANGSFNELLIDERGPVAGRLVHSDQSRAQVAQRVGIPCDIELSLSYHATSWAEGDGPLARDTGGKFRKRTEAEKEQRPSTYTFANTADDVPQSIP